MSPAFVPVMALGIQPELCQQCFDGSLEDSFSATGVRQLEIRISPNFTDGLKLLKHLKAW